MELKTDSDLYAIIQMLPAFGKYHNLVWAYVEQFGIRPMNRHVAKIRAILDAVKMVFDAEAFIFNRKRYPISHAGIGEALNVVVLKTFETPLENHNYLKKIMMQISEREGRESGKQAERELRAKESHLLAGKRYPEGEEGLRMPTMKDIPPAQMTEEQLERNRQRLKQMMESIGTPSSGRREPR